ncbi:10378_t:CDS:2 [Diversispora eburnea]|uniref:10378_t:CDS:1 n=1 Tax=Diversispora eburnea TaxID=1213867 RepID=A0A9N9BVF3_9GLOM|nr:10378_t:CDS:2 [Diversispora eburnea]
MTSFQRSVVLFFELALIVILLLTPISANNVVYRAISKRDKGNGRTTFYDVGTGACGETHTNDELVFALPASMFDPSPNGNPNLNPNCGRTAIVSRKVGRVTKKVKVTCVDRCVGCKYGDIDLSPKIAKLGEGRVEVTIDFQCD